MNIILIGFKNCGKTSVGQLVAELYHKRFIDTDKLIEKAYFAIKQVVATVKEIYKNEGESYFRALEKQTIMSLDKSSADIVATGGGSVLN